MTKSALALLAAGALSLGMTPASASTVDMTFDTLNSSVQITDQSGGGIVCYVTNCGIEATLSGSFGTPSSFSLAEGDTFSFDFIDFTFDGSTGVFPRQFDITATLAFSDPSFSATGTGTGGAWVVGGSINLDAGAGWLTWNNMPSTLTLADGTEFSIDFEDGATLFLGQPVTVGASVTAVSVAAVPLPASALVLVTGLGAIPLVGRRRRRKAAA